MNRTYTHSEPETNFHKSENFENKSEWFPLLCISLIGIIGLIASFLLST